MIYYQSYITNNVLPIILPEADLVMIEVNSLTVRTADTTRRPRETVEADPAMIEVNSLTVQTADTARRPL